MTESIDTRLLTAEDLYAFPDDRKRHELLSGRLTSEPPAGAEHGRVGVSIVIALGRHVIEKRLGRVYGPDTGFILARTPDTVRAPDIAFVSRARVEAAGRVIQYFPGAPDLAVEVNSPSDSLPAVRSKVADYLAAGCSMVWVVDPEERSVTVYRTLLAPRVLAADGMLHGEDVVPGFSIAVASIFE